MRIFCDPPYSAGWLVTRIQPPSLSATFFVKGAYLLKAGVPAEPAPEPALPSGDLHEGEDPAKILKYASDFAPLKTKTDILVNAVCHAPGGKSATVLRAGFRVGPLAKSVAVIGDRRWIPGMLSTSQTEPEPFTSMPIGWDRAYGGEKFRKNPVGRGRIKEAGPLPNVENVDRLLRGPSDAVDPAGFGPVDWSWEPRSAIKGTFKEKWLKERWPWYPEDFDFAVYNAAPADQQMAGFLKGDEEMSFDNLHPEHPKYTTRLPGVRVRGFVIDRIDGKTSFREVPLKIDTVCIDLVAGTLLLTWRGRVDVKSLKLKEVDSFLVRVEPLSSAPAAAEAVRAEHEAKLAAAAAPEPEDPEEAAEPETPLPPPPPPIGVAAVAAAMAEGMSFAGADLSGADFSGLDMAGRDMKDANLAGAMFRKTKLAGANFTGADLSGADFTEADLSGALLQLADFTGAKLGNSNLKGAKLDKSEFERASLAGANLEEAEGSGVSFFQCNLSGARLRKSKFAKCDFSQSVLEKADFTGAELPACGIEGARAAGAIFREANLANFRGSSIVDAKKVDFREVKGAKTVWTDSVLDGADFTGAKIPAADFSGASLAGAVFKRAEIVSGSFADADLRKASCPQVNLLRASFERADLGGADFQGSNLYEAEFWDAKVQGTDFRGANLKRTKLG